jgi:hypothetical protein
MPQDVVRYSTAFSAQGIGRKSIHVHVWDCGSRCMGATNHKCSVLFTKARQETKRPAAMLDAIRTFSLGNLQLARVGIRLLSIV